MTRTYWTSWRTPFLDHPTAYLTGQGPNDYCFCQLIRARNIREARAWTSRQPGAIEVRFCNEQPTLRYTPRFEHNRPVRTTPDGTIHTLPARLRKAQ